MFNQSRNQKNTSHFTLKYHFFSKVLKGLWILNLIFTVNFPRGCLRLLVTFFGLVSPLVVIPVCSLFYLR